MNNCNIITYNCAGNIIKLNIITIAEHQYIKACFKKIFAKNNSNSVIYLCFGKTA